MPTPCGPPCGGQVPVVHQAHEGRSSLHLACSGRGLDRRQSLVTYLRLSDLVKRWIYTRQGIQKLARSPGFPAPSITGPGRLRLWESPDIDRFEETHPEVIDADAKWRKIRNAGRRALYGRRTNGETPTTDA